MKEGFIKKYGQITENYSNFLEALLLSTIMAFLMLGLAFGLMYIKDKGIPIPGQFLLLILALSFIIGSVFYESRKVDRLVSLVYGGLFSASATFIITTLIGGVRHIPTVITSDQPSPSIIISSLAVCMIISMVLINLLTYE